MINAIDDILKFSQAALSEIGMLLPTLFVYGAMQGRVMVPIANLSEEGTQQRGNDLARIGSEMAENKNVGRLTHVFLVNQGWIASVPGRNNLTGFVPSRDPKGKEALVISSLDVGSSKQGSYAYEIIRESNGKFSGLKPVQELEGLASYSPLLPAFVNGYNALKKTAGN